MKELKEYVVTPLFHSSPVSDPQISGDHVMFTASKVNMEENKYESHLWHYDAASDKHTQFTYGTGGDSYPRWSPAGDKVLFLSNRVGVCDKPDAEPRSQLHVIPITGGEARKITYRDEAVQKPKWSPTGDKVLYLSQVFKGEKAYEESDVRIIRRIKYKWDGRGFFEGKYVHLFTVPTEGGESTQLTDGLWDVEAATWSPDGGRVAFVANLDEYADLTRFKNIYTVPTEGGEPQLLLKGEGSIQEIAWSPDGKYLAYTGRVIENPALVWFRNTEVFLLDLETGKTSCLTGQLDRTIRGEPQWSKDSKYVYFTAPDRGTTQVYRVNLQGETEQVTSGTFNVGGFSVSGGKLAFNASDSTTPHELYVYDGESRRVSSMSSGVMEEIGAVEPEEFWFTASDGVKVQGWLVKPRSVREGEKYPLVLEIHGGPHGAYGFNMGAAEHEFQLLSKHGYGVAYINPRGSVGYGEEFTRNVSGHWGERDYLDLHEALDHLEEHHPGVDPDRLGAAGGSFGGWMTNWIVGHTDRFKAAVTMRSIANWYSEHGTSDIGYMDHEISWGVEPWIDTARLLEKSPLMYVKNVKTPLLIIHSEQDYRCPMEQDEQLFTALMKLKQTAEFIRFPDESHGLSRNGKPLHREERLQHIIRWFDRYLK